MKYGVMFSIQARYTADICESVGQENRVVLRKKTLEVRKTRPKLRTPFKGFIYETKGVQVVHLKGCDITYRGRGKVIGEFICDYIYECPDIAGRCFLELNGSCLTLEELDEYSGGKTLYGIHITELVIYKKPKKLSEFRTPCKFFKRRVCGPRALCGEQKGICDGTKSFTSAPQSWGYVSI